MELISPFIEYDFMLRALLGCVLVCASATPVGVFLLLRKMSLTGDAMSHAILPGAAIGFMVAGLSVPAMTVGGLLAGMLVALLSGMTARATNHSEDASMAAFYLISLAVGVLIISAKGSSVDLMHVLFGSTLALNDEALMLLAWVMTFSLVGLTVIYRPLVIECVDPSFLRQVSRMGPWVHIGFLMLVVLNLVGGFHAMGTLMAVGLMILPAAAARFWTWRLNQMLLISFLIAVISCMSGLLLSFYMSWATSPAIILTAGAIYLISLVAGRNNGLLFQHERGVVAK